MKSFNDLWIKSNSFCHLREQFNESPSPRCPVMGSWKLSPRNLETLHHLTQVWNYYLPTWILIVWFPSPWCELCVPIGEMFLCLTPWVDPELLDLREDRSFLSFFPSRCHVGRSSWSKTSRQWRWSNQQSYEVQPGSWRLCWSCVPSVFLPHDLNLGTRFLFSGGELS